MSAKFETLTNPEDEEIKRMRLLHFSEISNKLKLLRTAYFTFCPSTLDEEKEKVIRHHLATIRHLEDQLSILNQQLKKYDN